MTSAISTQNIIRLLSITSLLGISVDSIVQKYFTANEIQLPLVFCEYAVGVTIKRKTTHTQRGR